MSRSSHRPVHVATPEPNVSRRADGSLLLSVEEPLAATPPHLGHWLRHWNETAPDRPFLAERNAEGGWTEVDYRQARTRVDQLSSALLAHDLGPDRPLVILSGNSIAHALLSFAAIQVGIPVAPLSVAYSMTSDHDKLGYLVELVEPGMIFAEDGPGFTPALRAIDCKDAALVHGRGAFDGIAGVAYETLLHARPGDAVEQAFETTGPEDVAKIMFTSGSTGMPKGVITTNLMLTSNQVAWRQVHPFLADQPPVVVDWLPWNHCFGGSYNLNMVLANGGTFHIDPGKPMPDQFGATLACLKEVSPTIYLNVPAGIDLLLPELEADDEFRAHFFRDLELVFYAGSILPKPLWERFEAVSAKACGKPVMITTAYGMTETGPMHTMACEPAPAPSHVGLPTPGSELLLIPIDDRYEIRCRGVNVTPGYFKREDLTAAAFDEEGFLITGDAVRYVDPEAPGRGLIFEGRIANNFKLLTGTWVQTDTIRVAAVAAAPEVVRDAIITGHDQAEIGLLIFPNVEGCRALCSGLPADASLGDIVKRPEVVNYLTARLNRHNMEFARGSRRIGRVQILNEAPEIYESELTDKTYINQRAALDRRRPLVETLYQDEPPAPVIVLAP